MDARKAADVARHKLNAGDADLLAELEAMLVPESDGLRTVELAAALGISEGTARSLLRVIDRQGRLDRVRKRFIRFDGRPTTVTAYRLKQQTNNAE